MSEGLEKKPLPPDWRWVKLGEVMPDYVGTIDPRQYPDELFALHSIPAYETGKPDILPGRKIGSSKQFVKVGDVLLSKIVPHIRRSWVVETCETENLIASTEWIVFRSNVVDPWFLQYALRTDEFHKRFIDTTSGVGGSLTRARPKLVAEITIPLPPLPEQQRIAAILREQMAVVDKARKAAEERLEAVKALPAAFLRQVFPQPGQPLPEGWRWVKLGEVLHLRSGEFLPATSMDEKGKFPVYGGNGVTGYHSCYMFEEPKVIIGRVGALCGCVHLTKPRSWITDNALYVDLKKNPLDDQFLFFILTKMDLRSLANQMGQPVISGSSIYEKEIPLPPLPEQQRIAAILREQMAAVDKARKAAEEELEAINALPAALLRRAFSGEL